LELAVDDFAALAGCAPYCILRFHETRSGRAALIAVEPGFPGCRKEPRGSRHALEFFRDATELTPVSGGKDAGLYVEDDCRYKVLRFGNLRYSRLGSLRYDLARIKMSLPIGDCQT